MPGRDVPLAQCDRARLGVVTGGGNGGSNGVERLRLSSRHEEGTTAFDNTSGDCGDLGRSFAYAEDYFGEALPDFPVVVDASEPKVFVRRRAQDFEELIGCGRRIDRAVAHSIEQLTKVGSVHNTRGNGPKWALFVDFGRLDNIIADCAV